MDKLTAPRPAGITDSHSEDEEPKKPKSPLTPEQIQAIESAKRFIEENAQTFALIMGASGLSIEVGTGWATSLRDGKVTVDPSFFVEKGYKPDWANYAMMHEVAAHLIELINNPLESQQRWKFAEQGRGKHMFLNILEDIAGNKRIHSLLPDQKRVAAEVYAEKLFESDDYTEYPMHIQFMYKMIKQEMVPGCQVLVDPRVDDALESLRNFEDKGIDMIELSTGRFEPNSTREMPREVQFRLWLDHIYPLFEKLRLESLEEFKKKRQEEGPKGQPIEGENEEGEGEGESEEAEGQYNDAFDDFYDDYEQNRHPEPIGHEELEDILKESVQSKIDEKPENKARAQKEKELKEMGHNSREFRAFRNELVSLSPQIAEMSEFFSRLLDERAITTRELSAARPEGAILNPNTLAQTIVDVKSRVPSPSQAFLDYQKIERERKAEGRFDCFLAVDCSGSMQGEKEKEARKATLVFLEGLAAFEREIRAREQSSGVQLDWDVRSSFSVFGSETEVVKPLSHELTEKQRLDAFTSVNSNGGATADYLSLENIIARIQDEIYANPDSKNRQRIVIVVTDGESADPARLEQAVNRLIALGASVIGIGIGPETSGINRSYPIAESITDVRSLSKTLTKMLESEIAKWPNH